MALVLTPPPITWHQGPPKERPGSRPACSGLQTPAGPEGPQWKFGLFCLLFSAAWLLSWAIYAVAKFAPAPLLELP